MLIEAISAEADTTHSLPDITAETDGFTALSTAMSSTPAKRFGDAEYSHVGHRHRVVKRSCFRRHGLSRPQLLYFLYVGRLDADAFKGDAAVARQIFTEVEHCDIEMGGGVAHIDVSCLLRTGERTAVDRTERTGVLTHVGV